MKQKTNIEKTASGRNRTGIKDALSGAFRTIIRVNNNIKIAHLGEGDEEGLSIFLVQNKGKGPPGRVRSPGTGCCLKPDNQPAALKSSKTYYKTEFQHFNKYQISNFKFLKQLNFTIMKKQIFILVFLVVATFASVTNSFGQTCDDALHPIAGKKYTYTVSVNPVGGTFNWYVVTQADLIAGTKADATYLIGGVGYNLPTSTSATVDITWSSKAVKEALAATTKFYLVVNYMNTGCTDNLKAYKITPINLFGILVENVNSTGAAYADICRSAVVSAVVDATDKITYNYGENALYLKVTANYFTTSWTPKIDITALKASMDVTQTIKSIEWSLTTTFLGTSNFDLTTGVATANVVDKGADGITSGTDEFVYVKVIITDGKFEGIALQNIALNVSAVDVSGNPDVDKNASCVDITPDPDNMVQVLKARPAITAATPIVVPAAGTGAFLLPN